MNPRQRFAGLSALKGSLAVLLGGTLMIGFGEELWLRFVPKYLLALGAGALVIGLYDMISVLLGGAIVGREGVVLNRWGVRRVFLFLHGASIAGYAIVLLIPSWSAVIFAAFFFLSWSCVSLPVTLLLLGDALHLNRSSKGIGIPMLARRLPVILSPILGGMLVDHFGIVNGVRIALIVSIVITGAVIFIERRSGGDWTPRESVSASTWNFLPALRTFTPELRNILLADILARSCTRIPFAWIVIFAMDYVGASGRHVGLLVSFETVVAIFCILPASYFADKLQREPFVVSTLVLSTLFPLVLVFGRSIPGLWIAFLIYGLAEIGAVPRDALILAQCGGDRRGPTMLAYRAARDGIVSLSALAGAYLWRLGPERNFLAAAMCGLFATILYVRNMRLEREAALVQLKHDLFQLRSSEKKL